MRQIMITSAQLRAARALIRWSTGDLANASGVGVATIKRLENGVGVPSGNLRTMAAIQQALEGAGVEFIGYPDDKPGVCLIQGAHVQEPKPRGTPKG
jgi:transcriptional regulator with XRE-family HTH domain